MGRGGGKGGGWGRWKRRWWYDTLADDTSRSLPKIRTRWELKIFILHYLRITRLSLHFQHASDSVAYPINDSKARYNLPYQNPRNFTLRTSL